jgi:hypothetical protein
LLGLPRNLPKVNTDVLAALQAPALDECCGLQKQLRQSSCTVDVCRHEHEGGLRLRLLHVGFQRVVLRRLAVCDLSSWFLLIVALPPLRLQQLLGAEDDDHATIGHHRQHARGLGD